VLLRADASRWRLSQLGQQLLGLLAAGVVLAGQERRDPLGAQRAGVGGARVALKERERDRAVQIAKAKQANRPRLEALKLGVQLV